MNSKANLTPEYITIDIAHGHSNAVIEMIQYIKRTYLKRSLSLVMLVHPEAVRELENAGADATKVGIGPGKVCITKLKLALVLVAGNWLLFAGAQKQLQNLSSLMAVSVTMATSLNLFALVRLWL